MGEGGIGGNERGTGEKDVVGGSQNKRKSCDSCSPCYLGSSLSLAIIHYSSFKCNYSYAPTCIFDHCTAIRVIQFSSVCAGSQMLLPSLPGLSFALHWLAG